MLGAIGYGVDNSNNSNIRNGLLAKITSNINTSEKDNKNTSISNNANKKLLKMLVKVIIQVQQLLQILVD